MALQSDSQGFLTGEIVTDIRRVSDELIGIRADVSAIRRAILGSTSRRGSQDSRSSSGSSNSNQNSRTINNGTATPNRASGSVSSEASRLISRPGNSVTPNRAPANSSRVRDASGRFIRNGGSDNGGDDTEEKKKKNNEYSFLNGFANRIATAVSSAGNGLEEVDPNIKAFKEVAEPMKRGYQAIFGGGDKKESWYRKIFNVLGKIRGEESIFNRIAKSLHNIENNPGGLGGAGGSSGGSGGGVGGGLMGMLAGLLGGKGLLSAGKGLLGMLSKNTLPVPSAAIPPAAGTGGIGSKLLRGGKGLLKRIPLLGALIGGASAASDIYGTENDDSLTRGEKDKRDGKTVGGLAGSFGGMAAGAAAGSLLGPVGTVVGGAVGMFLGDQGGQIIGEKIGEWTTQLREADIPGNIIGAWNTTTDAIKSGWDGALKLFSDAWGKAKDLGNAANDFVKDKTGVDVKAEVQGAHAKAVDFTANKIIAPGMELAEKGKDKLKQGAEWVGENTTIGKGVKAAVDSGVFDTTPHRRSKSKNIEGNKAAMIAEMDTQGIIDPKERAMLMAQVDHESGGFKYTKELGQDSYFDQYDAGTKKGNDLGNTEKGDGLKYKGRGLIQLTGKANYAAAGKDLGLDLINHPELAETSENAAKTAMWFWKKKNLCDAAKNGDVKSVTHKINGGENGLDDRASKYEKYLADANVTSPKAETQLAKNTEAAAASSPADSKITEPPAKPSISEDPTQGNPYLDAFAKANNPDSYRPLNSFVSPIGSAAQVQVASAPPVKPPVFSPPPAIPEAPPLIQPLGSNSNSNPTVVMQSGDVGQDVRDRGIAHIVTGGYSSRG